MPSGDGITGAVFLSTMLSIDRQLESRRAAEKECREEVERGNGAILQDSLIQRYEQLDVAYEALRKNYNALAREANQQDATIADLQRTKVDLEREAEQQRMKLEDVTTELAVLRQIDREQNPDAYGYR